MRIRIAAGAGLSERLSQHTTWGALARHVSDMVRRANLPGTAPIPQIGTGQLPFLEKYNTNKALLEF